MGINLDGAESWHDYVATLVAAGSADKRKGVNERRGSTAIRFTIPYVAIPEVEFSRYVSMLIVV
jgi:hypothetical protein